MRLFIILCFIYCASGQYEESESTSDYEDGYSDVDYNENHRDGPGGGIDLTDILDNGNEAKKFLDALENNSTNDVDDIEGDPFSLIPKMNFTQNTSVPEWWEPMFWSRSTPCDEWGPLNHYFFHIANIFLLFSYLAPNSIYGLLYLRFMVATGCVFFSLWGYFILCAFDTFFWNVILSGINLICIASMLWYLKPVCLPPELNEVYETLFKPLKVSKQQFKKTVGCIKEFREIQDHRHHAEEKVTNIETLSLLLRGRMIVSQKGRALHLIARNQFLDSPEWFGSSSDECFQVTITALEDCRVLVWQRDKLRLTLMSDPFLNAVFDHVLGRDVVKKLTQVQDAIVAMTGDWMLTEKTDVDEKQALIAKQIDDGPQIVAMLNRSYNGLFWNHKLPYIDDGEV